VRQLGELPPVIFDKTVNGPFSIVVASDNDEPTLLWQVGEFTEMG